MDDLLPRYDWTADDAAIDDPLLRAILGWAWTQSDMRRSLIESYPQPGREPVLPPIDDLYGQLVPWLNGDTFAEIAQGHKYDIDRILRIHSGVVSFTLATLVEQAIAVLTRYFEQTGQDIAPVITLLPDFLRYGTTSTDARDLLAKGVRHRRAAILLGAAFTTDLDTFSSRRSSRRPASLKQTAGAMPPSCTTAYPDTDFTRGCLSKSRAECVIAPRPTVLDARDARTATLVGLGCRFRPALILESVEENRYPGV